MDRMEMARELASVADVLGHVSEAILQGRVYPPRRRRASAATLLEQQIDRLRRMGRRLVREERDEAEMVQAPPDVACSACGRRASLYLAAGSRHICLDCVATQAREAVQ